MPLAFQTSLISEIENPITEIRGKQYQRLNLVVPVPKLEPLRRIHVWLCHATCDGYDPETSGEFRFFDTESDRDDALRMMRSGEFPTECETFDDRLFGIRILKQNHHA